MDDTYAMTPRQALRVIEVAGVEDAAKLVRDHAAAGLVRSYAQLQVTIFANRGRHEVRGGRVLPATWERIVAAGADQDVWSGGTVRLPGSELMGGTPAIHVTGVAFHPGDIDRLANQQRPTATAKRTKPTTPAEVINDATERSVVAPRRQKATPDLSALHSGALLLTVKQAQAALAQGRTTIYKWIGEGKLERPKDQSRITAASVRRCAGLPD